jgi:hypothetical protein
MEAIAAMGASSLGSRTRVIKLAPSTTNVKTAILGSGLVSDL